MADTPGMPPASSDGQQSISQNQSPQNAAPCQVSVAASESPAASSTSGVSAPPNTDVASGQPATSNNEMNGQPVAGTYAAGSQSGIADNVAGAQPTAGSFSAPPFPASSGRQAPQPPVTSGYQGPQSSFTGAPCTQSVYPWGQPNYYGGPAPAAAAPKASHGFAVAALVCGIASIIVSGSLGLGLAMGIVAIVFSCVSKKNEGVDKRAFAGKVCGIIGIILSILIGGFMMGSGSITSPFKQSVGIINIDGVIGQSSGANTPEGLAAALNEAENDSSIKAVVLRVNSGGGASASGEEMAVYVKNFSKPVVVSSATTNASAAYLISSQADYIYANKSSAVGAIGTAMQVMDYSRLLDTLGIDVRNITSSKSKDSSYGTRPLTEEEIQYYQDLVNKINEDFITSVAEGRSMNVEKVRKLANGMTYTGTDAVSNGLIDEIGTFEDACDKAAELAHLSSYNVVSLDSTNEMSALLDALSSFTNAFTSSKQAVNTTTLLSEGTSYNGSY